MVRKTKQLGGGLPVTKSIKMKKLSILLLACLLAGAAQSQTVLIGTAGVGYGQLVQVEVEARGWVDIEAITMSIAFDQSQLGFIACTFHHDFVETIYNNDNGVIRMSWYSLTPTSLPYGKFATLWFVQWGSSPLTFVPINEFIRHPFIPVNMTYINGKVYIPTKKYWHTQHK